MNTSRCHSRHRKRCQCHRMGNWGWTGSGAGVHSISARPKQEERAAIEATERSKMIDRHPLESGLVNCISKIQSIIGPLFIAQVVRGTNKALSSVYPGLSNTTANIRLNGRTVSFNVTLLTSTTKLNQNAARYEPPSPSLTLSVCSCPYRDRRL